MPGEGLGPPDERISVSLLTGFLGSGKTTVLNRLLGHPDMGETAVIVNEFGPIPLDHLLVESSVEDMVVLESGCVCCSVRDDLLDTMNGLWERRAGGEVPPFERCVIETTGLADPAPILKTIMQDPDLAARFWLDAVLATVDAVNASDTLDRHFESVKQVAVADRLLLTKLDLVDSGRFASLEERLWRINPSAPHVRVADALEPSALFDAALFHARSQLPDVDGWLRDDAYDAIDPGDDSFHHGDRVRSFCISYEEPIPVSVFEAWLTALMHFKGPDLLRVKGLVRLAELDRPAVIHLVQHAFHPPITLESWPTADRRTRIVFITRDVDQAAITAALDRVRDGYEAR